MVRYLLVVLAGLLLSSVARADGFDQYNNPTLGKLLEDGGAKKVEYVTQETLLEHTRVLPGISLAFVVVKTNEGKLCKLLVMPARQKIDKKTSVPILLVDRFVTFRDGEERAIDAQGKNVRLFGDFRFSLDLGQVVPGSVPADVRCVVNDDQVRLEAVDKAELYLVTKHLAKPTKSPAGPAAGEQFGTHFFNGVFKLYDDGKRSGTLRLKVGEEGEVVGSFYSDKDGKKYEVAGKVGDPHHSIRFRITYPKTVQEFQGWIFTGNGAALTGSARFGERESGFYAVRQEK